MSISLTRSSFCMASAWAIAFCIGSFMSSWPPHLVRRSMASRTQNPNREFPHRRWWSRNESGAPTGKVCSQSATLASSTAMGFLSTPVDAAFQDRASNNVPVVQMLNDERPLVDGRLTNDVSAGLLDAGKYWRAIGLIRPIDDQFRFRDGGKNFVRQPIHKVH